MAAFGTQNAGTATRTPDAVFALQNAHQAIKTWEYHAQSTLMAVVLENQ